MIQITREKAQKIAVMRQRLAGPKAPANLEGIKDILKDIRCIQIDPLRPVERTQYLVLFSRLGVYDPGLLDELAYKEKFLFEYWAHAASYVLTEDFPLHFENMKQVNVGGGVWGERIRNWLEANHQFRAEILDSLRENGPTLAKDIQDTSVQTWESSGWNSNRNTTMMMMFLWDQGEVFVSHREGIKKYWDLRERVLPEEAQQEVLAPEEIVYRAAQISLRALGVATEKQIKNHFIRKRYPNLPAILDQLAAEKKILPVGIQDLEDPKISQEKWFIHRDDLDLLERLEKDWLPRTTLLSPFDNLICDRDRTEWLWDFLFRIEIYVPKNKRQYGYYVMPILHGNRLIGRLDPQMDRKKKVLNILSVYAEADAPDDRETVSAVRQTIQDLAEFAGAKEIRFAGKMPAGWEALSKI